MTKIPLKNQYVQYAPLSFRLIELYRLKFYMYYFIRIYTVHFINRLIKIQMFLTDSQTGDCSWYVLYLSLEVLIKKGSYI